ncbi:hypothetical protein E4U55_003631 [Claviceps digitariae]|nr:hypothetical protein E4U55_003631 [Claviceps digitariae]
MVSISGCLYAMYNIKAGDLETFTKSSASSPKPQRRLKSACSSLPPFCPTEAAVVQDDIASLSKLESAQDIKDLDLKAKATTTRKKRRRPSSWDPLARYYSEAHSFPDYGTASDKMPQTWLRELNGSTAGGLNTLTNPPLPLIQQYSPGERPGSKRYKPNDAQDSSYSRFFPPPKRHRTNETHDLTFSDSQEDPYDFRSNSSTGKPRAARTGVEEFRHAQPKSNAVRRSRTRKSRVSLSRQQSSLDEAVGKGGNENIDSPDRSKNSESLLDTPEILLVDPDPPPSNIRSDLVRPGPKRSRLASRTETTSPHFKRPRIHQSIESIESEDELNQVQHRQKRRTNFSDLFDPKNKPTRGDIQPTQFMKPCPKPSRAPVPVPAARVLQVHVRRAVSGKNIFAGDQDERPLVLQQAGSETPHILSPKCTRDAKSPLDWLAIDLDKVTKIEHAASETHFVHVVRPRSNHFESSLWLELMDHRDVLSLTGSRIRDRAVNVAQHELEIKWEQAWNKANHYRDTMNTARPSVSMPSAQQQDEVQMVKNSRQSDKEDTTAGSRRTVKLVDQMRESMRNAQALPMEAPEDSGAAVVKAPGTRRTRRSSPVHIPQDIIPERWTDENPDWTAQWHKSLVFPATGKNRATVDDGDIPRLDEGEFLNDNLISFYIRYLQIKLESERPELLSKVYFFSTFFFEKLTSTKGQINYVGVKAWTAKVDLLSYDYIVVPVNEHAHWYLALICNVPNAVKGMPQEDSSEDHHEHVKDSSPRIAAIEKDMSDVTIRDGETKRQSADMETLRPVASSPKTMQNSSPTSKTMAPPGSQSSTATQRTDDPKAPKIITLDSLANPHPTTCRVLREYLGAEAKDKKGVDLVKVPHGMTAKKIPVQNNYCDCGVFVLGYMEEFLKDPDETARKLLQREPLGWDIRPSEMRKSLRDLLFEMQREQHERQIKEKEQKRLATAKRKALAKDADIPTGRAAAKSAPLTPGRISTAAEVPDGVMAVSQTSSPAVVRAALKDDVAKSRTQTVAKPSPVALRVDASTGNKDKSHGGGGGPNPSLTGHEAVKGRTAVSGTKTPATTTSSSMGPYLTKQDLVETLPTSSSEAEGQRARAQLKRTPIKKSTDVEEVMSITRSRPTRRTSKQVESSPSLVRPLSSSGSPLPTRQEAKYDGIERSVDLT